MTIEMGPGKTKGKTPEQQREAKLAARDRKRRAHHGHVRQLSADQKRRIAIADKTQEILGEKLKSSPDTIQIVEFMLSKYKTIETRGNESEFYLTTKLTRRRFLGTPKEHALRHAISATMAEIAEQIRQHDVAKKELISA